MSIKKEHTSLRDAALIIGRPINYYPSFTKALGGHGNAGIFASNFYYWEGKGKDPNGWIYKTQQQIEEETGLTRYGQEGARKKLRQLGLLQETKRGQPGRLHYLFDWDAMDELLILAKTGTKKAIKLHIKEQKEKTETAELQQVPEVRSTNYVKPCIEVFDLKYKEYQQTKKMDGNVRKSISWVGKEIGQLKNLYQLFRKRLDKDDKKSTPEEVAKALSDFLDFYMALSKAGFFYAQFCTPSYIYSNINKIYEAAEQHYQSFTQTGTVPGYRSKPNQKGHKFNETDADSFRNAANWGS